MSNEKINLYLKDIRKDKKLIEEQIEILRDVLGKEKEISLKSHKECFESKKENMKDNLEKAEYVLETLENMARGLYTLKVIFERYGEEVVRSWTREQFEKRTNRDLKIVDNALARNEQIYREQIVLQYKKDLHVAKHYLFEIGV